MPKSRFSPDEDDFIMKMRELEYSNYEIAAKLGVSEGTIRYRMKRQQSGREDSRVNVKDFSHHSGKDISH